MSSTSDLKSLTSEDLLNSIISQCEEDFDYFDYNELFEMADNQHVFGPSGWKLDLLKNKGGMDQGTEYWYVFSVSDGVTVRTVKVEGYYQSHGGAYYDEWHETFPELKTITVWS